MRARFLAAAAIGALLAGPALAQTDGNSGAMSEQDMEKLGSTFEQAGFTNFRPVTGADVFRGMSTDGTAAVIAVAPDSGNTAESGSSGDTASTGMAGSQMFQVTTEGGRTLYIVVPPEMTGMTGMNSSGTESGSSASSTSDTQSTDAAASTAADDDDDDADASTAGSTTADSTSGDATSGQTSESTSADASSDSTAAGSSDTAGQSGELSMNIELTGAQQVPPVETSGSGQVDVSFNSETRELSWELNYSDLSSDATAAHFHGPADPGETAPPVVPLDDFSDGANGSETLTESQAEQVMAGKWYFNLHTENNPNGEIRGQVTAVK